MLRILFAQYSFRYFAILGLQGQSKNAGSNSSIIGSHMERRKEKKERMKGRKKSLAQESLVILVRQ